MEEPVLSGLEGHSHMIDRILALEGRLLNAWPSFDYQFYDGWLLRFADGYSKRANSATPIVPGARLDDALFDIMVARFLAANVRPTFRLTGAEDPSVGDFLAGKGFETLEPTLVMTMPIGGECEADADILIEPDVTKRWVKDTAASYGGDKADHSVLIEIVSRIRQDTAFATLSLDEKPVAWGLGVAERGYVGLYDIVVAPDLRGIGLGRRVVSSLIGWGCQRGAETAYLQVREENEIAQSLYTALGFASAYRYTHRVMPRAAM